MKLLYTKRSPYARKARIIAIEKGLKIEYIDEDLASKSRLLLECNPVGRIPALVINDKTTLCDSPLICEYLDSLSPSPRFIPEDPAGRWEVLNTAALADGLIDITLGAYMEKIRHPHDFNQKFVDAQYDSITRILEYFEGQVADLKKWHLGSVGVVCAIGYLRFRLGEHYHGEKTPQLDRWLDDVSSRPSVKETLPVA